MRTVFLFTAVAIAAFGVSLGGCGNGGAEKKDAAAGGDVHDHHSEGPHKGVIVELGDEEYHGEVVHDEATHRVTVYILDSKAKNAVAIDAAEVKINVVADGKPAQYVLPAMPLDGETGGKSSRFELSDEGLCDGMCAEGAAARLKVTINGTPFEGKIPAHDHDDHDH